MNGSLFHHFTIHITPNSHLYLHATQNGGKWENMNKLVHMRVIFPYSDDKNYANFKKSEKQGSKLANFKVMSKI